MASTAVSTLAWPVMSTTSVAGLLLEVLEEVEAAAVGQVQVDEQDVGHLPADLGPRLLQGVRRLGGEAFAADDLGQPEDEVHVVVDEQCVRHYASVSTACGAYAVKGERSWLSSIGPGGCKKQATNAATVSVRSEPRGHAHFEALGSDIGRAPRAATARPECTVYNPWEAATLHFRDSRRPRGTSLALVALSRRCEEKGARPHGDDHAIREWHIRVRPPVPWKAWCTRFSPMLPSRWTSSSARGSRRTGGMQFVCRVETPPATPFGAAMQWRWWSPLVDGPEELREALSAAVQARGAARAKAPSVADARGQPLRRLGLGHGKE